MWSCRSGSDEIIDCNVIYIPSSLMYFCSFSVVHHSFFMFAVNKSFSLYVDLFMSVTVRALRCSRDLLIFFSLCPFYTIPVTFPSRLYPPSGKFCAILVCCSFCTTVRRYYGSIPRFNHFHPIIFNFPFLFPFPRHPLAGTYMILEPLSKATWLTLCSVFGSFKTSLMLSSSSIWSMVYLFVFLSFAYPLFRFFISIFWLSFHFLSQYPCIFDIYADTAPHVDTWTEFWHI